MALTGDEWATLARPWNVIGHSMHRGDVASVRRLLGDVGLRATVKSRLDDAEAFLASAGAWLAEAEAYEAAHGQGSRLVPDHPFNLELARLRRFEQQQARWRTWALSQTRDAGLNVAGIRGAQPL